MKVYLGNPNILSQNYLKEIFGMKRNVFIASILYTIIFSILLLNSFVSNILGYWEMALLTSIILLAFKLLFGFEKDNHRYTKDIILNITIIILSSFISFYISGLFIGFTRPSMPLSINTIKNFILPMSIWILIKEYLRYQMIIKFHDNRVLFILTIMLFIFMDITGSVNMGTMRGNYQSFIIVALIVLPSISRNIVASYISYKVGYKPNWIWICIVSLYSSILPIIPNTGEYILSLLKLLFPLLIGYNTYSFFQNRKYNIPLSYNKNKTWGLLATTLVFVIVIVYFTSGYFKYFSIAIATGSMTPNIYKGDVVVINQKYKLDELNVGDVIAYKYEGKIIVHRIAKVAKYRDEKIFYTQGDANNTIDEYIVYPETIMGSVKWKIPYIGLPTVWLNEL